MCVATAVSGKIMNGGGRECPSQKIGCRVINSFAANYSTICTVYF